MSGHNKFSKIKRQKEATDAKKSKLFSQLVKQIITESRLAKGDRNSAGVKVAIEKAKAANMPSDNIERALKKGAGIGAGSMEEIICEAYGPGGVGIIIEGVTDNKNRTINEIKFILSESGSGLAGHGAVTWAFTKQDSEWEATTRIQLSDEDREKLDEIITTLENNPDIENIYTNAQSLYN
ncbi:MAG: YebC/PmpR family DNA-binding transcriptional regulator [Candidatus Vogelbacteria bacterium]|nr:YebC/PmpR family DNA-binding transcriptional regulator [Candidatus Vogelbacteria bacterium]